jgi:phage repressor protein C with HTH and peptisase S24 domain
MSIDRRGDFIAVILDGKADAMRPTLAPGDICLVNRREKFILKKNNYQLFLVNWGDSSSGTAVKRVSAYKQQLILSSDNHLPRYAPIPIAIDNRDVNQIIIGRVVWAGKILVDFAPSEDR